MTSDNRCRNTTEAMKQYAATDEDLETNVVDLLEDLHHWCVRMHVDFGICLRIAKDHFEAES